MSIENTHQTSKTIIKNAPVLQGAIFIAALAIISEHAQPYLNEGNESKRVLCKEYRLR